MDVDPSRVRDGVNEEEYEETPLSFGEAIASTIAQERPCQSKAY